MPLASAAPILSLACGAADSVMDLGIPVTDPDCRGLAERADLWPAVASAGWAVGDHQLSGWGEDIPWSAEMPQWKILGLFNAERGAFFEMFGRAPVSLPPPTFSHLSLDGSFRESVAGNLDDRGHVGVIDVPGAIEFSGPGCHYVWIRIDGELVGPWGMNVVAAPTR